MTGSLKLNIFFGYMPNTPVFTSAAAGKEVAVYVGGGLAFAGVVDKRTGAGVRSGEADSKDSGPSGFDRSVDIGPDQYNVSLTARGKTKVLVDSSHRHPTTNILKTTNKEAIEKLLEGSNISLEWLATTIQLDKVRLRDGGRVVDEIHNICNENAHFVYETRDGKLRVTDDTARVQGDPLVLGDNILTFSASQGEDSGRSEIKVKGQRIPKDTWGEDAVLKTFKILSDAASTNKAPVIIQHYGDATDEALQRRAEFEANKRTSASKEVRIKVFHVQANSAPWDVGNLHYVEIPPEGLFDVMECTGVEYSVDATKELSTTLTLAPVPTRGPGGISAGFGLISNAIQELAAVGLSRKAAAGVETAPGDYPGTWGGAQLGIPDPATSVFNVLTSVVSSLLTGPTIPLTLPPGLESDE
jgi:prophage tail gpP-like protein